MYEKEDRDQMTLSAFSLPFDGKLNASNRWIRLSRRIDWDKLEDDYAQLFSAHGKRAVKCRAAYAALLIKEILEISDRETVEQISENPYMQYFCGFPEFRQKRPFSPRTMSAFRHRFKPELLSRKQIRTVQGKGKKK